MAMDGKRLAGLLDRIGNRNAKGEYYLTDIVALARADGLVATVVRTTDVDETMGVNSRAELVKAEAAMQARLRARAMMGGATLTAPETVFFAADTVVGRDVVIGPNVVFGNGVTIADDVEIRAFCHIEGAKIASGAVIGPFARLRPGADIGKDAHVGNFVEVKNARLEEGAKANHLSYLGDARVGAKANVGAGTITCNYDGFLKSHTDIGAGAFIGSNTALVAPVKIGDGAIIGAGSTIAKDVPADAVAVTRAEQSVKPGGAKRYRERKKAEKAAIEAAKAGKSKTRKAG
jgi:bifunctional UDP-N-acetylglucosamine pyrophosphorylase/glucosamine-1-phosphate N-acetyltransferase